MLKLKLQYFGHLMRRTDSLEKTLTLGKIEDSRRRRQHRTRWLDGITNSMGMSLSNSGSWWWTGKHGVLQSMGLQRVGCNWVTELNWTDYQQFVPSLSTILPSFQVWCIAITLEMLSHFSRVWLFTTPWTVTCQAPLSMGFSRQEYWAGLPCTPPDLPDPGIEPESIMSPTFTTSATWKALVSQAVKNLPATWETQFQFLGQEDPLEKGMATHSSILDRKIPWTEEPGRL